MKTQKEFILLTKKYSWSSILGNQEDLARIQEFTLKSNFAAPIEVSVHKILYEATFYKGLDY